MGNPEGTRTDQLWKQNEDPQLEQNHSNMAQADYNRNASSSVCPVLVLLPSHPLSITATRLAGTFAKIQLSSSSYFEQAPEQRHKMDKSHTSRERQLCLCLAQGAMEKHMKDHKPSPSVQNTKFFNQPSSFAQPQKSKTQPGFR